MSGVMPIGVIVNALSVALGGVIGTLLGQRVPEEFRRNLNSILGLSGIAMGIVTVIMVKNLPAVIFSTIAGTAIGMLLMLERRVERLSWAVQSKLSSGGGSSSEQISEIVTIAVLFCASGTGIYGSIVSGITGDQSILLTKSVLDFFTAAIFACSLGIIVSVVSVPQVVFFLLLFFLSRFIMPLTTPDMISDFRACGGVIMIASGFRILKIKMFPITDMLPAMFVVFPVSWFWTAFILPLVG